MYADTVAPSPSTPKASPTAAPDRYAPRSEKAAPPRSERFDRSDEGVTAVNQTHESLTQIGAACMTVGSDNLSVLTEASTLTSRFITDLTKSCVDTLSYAAVMWTTLGRDYVSCRTPADVTEFQKKALEGFTETYEASGKAWRGVFGAFSAAFEPLMVRAADGPERMFRAFAD